MTKPILLIFILSVLLAACSPPDKAPEKPRLKYFEISYHSGWAERFSMKADSAGRFIFSHRLDSFYTGILPDSLRDSLYSICTLIKKDSTCMNTGDRCDDCGAVHLKLVISMDSADRVQLGHFCEAIQNL